METRLIIAYSLIAIMVAIALVGSIVIQRKLAKAKRRDAGFGDHRG